MSGSIGANRIPKAAVKTTVDRYIKDVLEGFEGFKSAKITGSYNTPNSKKDYGDVDLCVYIETNGKSLVQVKREFKSYLESLDDSLTIPFASGRNKGKKAQMYGTIVTCQTPIDGFEGLGVQIDNMIVSSEQDQEYTKSFLDADAAKQGLLMGLVRVILTIEKPESVFARLGIKKLPELEDGQEFEFVLSGNGLSLRKVTLKDFKEVDREEIWRSSNWQDVVKLLKDFDISQDFDHLLGQVEDKVQDARSRRRIIGIMKSMINVGVGEKGTPKGDAKERAIQAAVSSLGTLKEVEGESKGVIGLYGGGFKPPHKGHFSVVENLLKKADKVIILIGNGTRNGIPINQEQSKKIWEIYISAAGWGSRVEIRVCNSPVSETYSIIKNPDLQNYQYLIPVSGNQDEEAKKWKYLEAHKDEYPNVKLIKLPTVIDKESNKLSATTLRASAERIKKGDWIPSVLTNVDAAKVIDIALKEITLQEIREGMSTKLGNVVDSVVEGMSGTAIAPTSVIASKNKEKLSQFYEYLLQNFEDQFNVQFNGSHIIIKTKYPGDMENFDYESFAQNQDNYLNEDTEPEHSDKATEFDWTSNLASLISFMEKEGCNLQPLPEIIINKSPRDGSLQAKTGNYDIQDKIITIQVGDRDPVDALRSASHELYHHHQGLLGKFDKKDIDGEKVSASTVLEDLEGECYKEANLLFRKWLESKGCYEK